MWTVRQIAPERRSLLTISVLVALLSHVIFLVVLPSSLQNSQNNDYTAYYRPVADNLLSGKGLSLGGGPAVLYPPGMSVLYAGVFWVSDKLRVSREVGLHLLQAVFISSSSALVGLLGLEIFSWRVALAASVIWSTYPFNLWLTKQQDVSNMIATVLLLCALLFLRWTRDGCCSKRRGLLLGGLMALMALTKPSTLGFPILFAGLSFLCKVTGQLRKRCLIAASIVVAFFLLILPWETWAWTSTGRWIPLCTNGPNALIDGLTFGAVRRAAPVQLPPRVHALTELAVANYGQLKTTKDITIFLVQQAKERPLPLAELFLLKAARTWYGSETHRHETCVAVIQLCYLPFVIFGVLLIWKGSTPQRNFILLTLGIVLYFWAITIFTALPLLRYMVPAASFLSFLAAAAIDSMARRTRCFLAVKPDRGMPRCAISEHFSVARKGIAHDLRRNNTDCAGQFIPAGHQMGN
jgi:4-amino-4-deoxy-L-arabinose transferase-like glycosyltransferase